MTPGGATPPGAPLLAVRDLSVTRGGRRVLEGMGFDLRPAQALILRGPNGIGKTTLLRCIAGLQPPVAGTILRDPDAVAYAAHSDGLKPALTAAENLRFWAAVFGAAPDAAPARALRAMALEPFHDRPAALLSAGQKRRLGLARLLVTGRPLWVLDEPTVSLDAASVALFAGVIRDHLAQGGAALIATHIDLALPEARVLDLAPFAARGPRHGPAGRPTSFDEAFA